MLSLVCMLEPVPSRQNVVASCMIATSPSKSKLTTVGYEPLNLDREGLTTAAFKTNVVLQSDKI